MDAISRQGYTYQTVLGSIGLNHMNGRVQDAMTGRFISADPYITEPTNTQNYNRYSYVYNNPLTNIDPSGFDSCSVWSDAFWTGSTDFYNSQHELVRHDDHYSTEWHISCIPSLPNLFPTAPTITFKPPPQPEKCTSVVELCNPANQKPQKKQEQKKCSYLSTYWSNVKSNFNATNAAMGGWYTPAKMSAGGATSRALFGTGDATLLKWGWSGFSSIATPAGCSLTVAESAMAVGATMAVDAAAVGASFEAGNFVGSLISAIPTSSNTTVSDSVSNAIQWELTVDTNPDNYASQSTCQPQ
jgi:RHS repeat-associated protein